ncbi:MAG: 3-phosphoglycerate dehydrogenase [Sulfolobaceae archaeon]|nr:3-phosphoglycerate dehydrogenase [Sulfolobaceae archaeon]
MTTKIVSTEELPLECRKLLANFGLKEVNFNEYDLESTEVIMAWPRQITKEIVGKAKYLKFIQTFSAGVDDLDFSVIPETVQVFSNAGAYALSVAEHTWALILALAKGIGLRKRVESYQIDGKVLLILGGGGIGSEVARIGKEGFNTFNIGLSRSFKKPEYFDIRDSITKLGEYITKADIIVDALPLNKYTKGILNYDILKFVKNKVIIVNVGRGETIDEDGIYRLLVERPTVRFGTDVFWRHNGKEDFESKLWNLENFIGTLHTAGGYASQEVLEKAKMRACENVYKLLTTGNAENKVKREDYI